MCGRLCRVSITDMSSAACTVGAVAWAITSNKPAGGRLRLSSVKKAGVPPTIGRPGNARRSAAAMVGSSGAGGRGSPGWNDCRSEAGKAANDLAFRVIGADEDQFGRDRSPGRLGELRRRLDRRFAVALARIVAVEEFEWAEGGKTFRMGEARGRHIGVEADLQRRG